ncbi:MAG: hypothetical protein ACLUZU_12095 [Faecalibacillus intestinalis]|uniref:hypothetical protein n=1 Tax=Faecalibacillus intestinalis TaxID=1982626 RepID=UPI003999F58D
MARERGTFNFSASLEVKKQAPLDARQTYIDYSELIQEATWKDSDNKVWLFKGLTVPVNYNGEHALFMLTNPDNYTSTSSWIRVDGGGAESNVYVLPGNIEHININSNPKDLELVLGNYLDLKSAVLSKNIIVTRTSILNVAIGGIDGLSVIIDYMYFGEDKISKYQYFLRTDEYYKWKQISSIEERVLLKVDTVLDDTSNNAIANKPITSIIKKIINWH